MNRVIIAGLVALWGSAVAMVLTAFRWDFGFFGLAASCLIAGLITAPLFLKVENHLPWSVFAAFASTFLGAGIYGALWEGMGRGFWTALDIFFATPLFLAIVLAEDAPALLSWVAGEVLIHFVGRQLVKRQLP